MKKITLLLSILALVGLSSCAEKATINGDFQTKKFDGEVVFLQYPDLLKNDVAVLDSATVVDGKFTFSSVAPEKPAMRVLSIGKLKETTVPRRDHITMASVISEAGVVNVIMGENDLIVSGTPLNDEYNKHHAISNEANVLVNQLAEIGALENPELIDPAIRAQIEDKMKKVSDIDYELAKKNMDNPVGEYLFVTTLGALKDEQIIELLDMSSQEFQDNESMQQFRSQVEVVLARKKATLNQPFKDATIFNVKGEEESLAKHIGQGKYVFLDFWAAWCPPCIQEMPFLVETYAQYKDKGFEIVGVSLDKDKQDWTDAIKKHNMTWPQLLDTNAEAASIYKVETIPYTLLIDPNGVIIDMNLRGDALAKKLAELLDK